MKKILSILSVAVLFLSGCTGKYISSEDPELFEKENSDAKRYIGIMPENVKTIACIAPGSYPGSKHHRKGIKLLQDAGYKIKIMPHAFVRQKDIARAPLEGRVSDFYAAWNDPEVDMIFCLRGGMGSEEVLDHLDWSKLKKRPELYFQGYSDVTLIVCALLAKGYGHPIAGVMSGSLPGLTDDSVDAMRKMNHGKKLGPIKVKTLIPGDCQGTPVGGSLWKLCRLTEKDYCPDTAGKIIFIEASKVKPAQVREKLYELLNKKFFEKSAGVVFGLFASCNPPEELEKVFREIAPKLGVPVYSGYPFGHVPRCYSIDFMRPVRIRDGMVIFPEIP